jgi:hypothetical protein
VLIEVAVTGDRNKVSEESIWYDSKM